ncbi:MAG: nucleotidyl transferase AbiEii/AbiGii toxin family protein [Spirochaetaceae bacterium]
MTIQNALLKAIDGLNNSGVDYALAGGFALSAHVEPRSTVDIDILIFGGLDSLEGALASVFASVYRNLESMEYPLVTVHRFLVMEGEEEFVIDALVPNEDSFADEAAGHTERVELFGRTLRICGPDLLYVLKRASDRPRDHLDAEDLQRAANARMDRSFVNRWTPDPGS